MKRNILITSVITAVLCLVVVYAVSQSSLNINGSITATGNLAMAFQDGGTCVGTPANSSFTPSGTISLTPGTTDATFTVDLYTPGDTVVCTIPVKNTGNLVAKYSSSSITNDLSESSTPISVSVTSSKVETTTDNGQINAGGSANIIVTIKYNYEGEAQPIGNNSSTFKVTANYVQAQLEK